MIHRSLSDLMDWLDAHAPEVRDLEVGTGGYSPLGHSPLGLSSGERRAWHENIRSRGYRVAALNVSGNPLHPDGAIGERHDADLRATIALAAELGVDRVVAMSGTPAAGPASSSAPHFAANAWLPDYAGIADWQWEHRVGPYWIEIDALVRRTHPELLICLELHPGAYVFNVATFERLHAAAPAIGVNLDPSHLFWQGMDPLRVIERLGPSIGYAHAKDVRYVDDELALNGLLDNRWPGEPRQIPWDFAAVGHGMHDVEWWRAFVAALERETRASTISIEHEDRLVSPELGVASSARLFAAIAGEGHPSS